MLANGDPDCPKRFRNLHVACPWACKNVSKAYGTCMFLARWDSTCSECISNLHASYQWRSTMLTMHLWIYVSCSWGPKTLEIHNEIVCFLLWGHCWWQNGNNSGTERGPNHKGKRTGQILDTAGGGELTNLKKSVRWNVSPHLLWIIVLCACFAVPTWKPMLWTCGLCLSLFVLSFFFALGASEGTWNPWGNWVGAAGATRGPSGDNGNP